MANVHPITRSKVQTRASRPKLDYGIPYFGDLDTTSDPSGMSEINTPDSLNVVYDSVKAVMAAPRYTKLLTTKTPSWIGGMYSLYQTTGTRQLLYASNTNLYIYNNAGGSTIVNGTNGIPFNFTANRMWSFDEYMDSVYGGNGIDGLIAYNGSSISIANSGISPQFVVARSNRIYCANPNSSTLYFSDASNPTSFPVNNFIQINTNDGQNITGLAELNGNLVIYKDESIWILIGEPLGVGNTTTIGNLQMRKVNSPVGCSAFRTICKVDQIIFFMHYSGVYALQNYSASLVTPLLNNSFLSGMNTGFLNLCWAIYNAPRKKYILGYPSSVSTVCDSALVYDLLVKQWSKWDHLPGSCAVNYKFSGMQQQVLMGDPSAGNIYELFQGYADIAGDNGSATGGTTTTLVDTTKNWTANIFTDCRVMIGNNLGAYTTAIVQSNTATTLTFTTTLSSPVPASTPYSIGYYTSYWKTKVFDFEATGYSKKYRFWNLFLDNENYPILFGSAIDYAPCVFQKQFNMGAQSLQWDSGINWDTPGLVWDSGASSIFGQANVGGTGRHIQIIFGNNLANQPWRAIKQSFQYKLKKERTSIVTT